MCVKRENQAAVGKAVVSGEKGSDNLKRNQLFLKKI
jgi:hypothetical protein